MLVFTALLVDMLFVCDFLQSVVVLVVVVVVVVVTHSLTIAISSKSIRCGDRPQARRIGFAPLFNGSSGQQIVEIQSTKQSSHFWKSVATRKRMNIQLIHLFKIYHQLRVLYRLYRLH